SQLKVRAHFKITVTLVEFVGEYRAVAVDGPRGYDGASPPYILNFIDGSIVKCDPPEKEQPLYSGLLVMGDKVLRYKRQTTGKHSKVRAQLCVWSVETGKLLRAVEVSHNNLSLNRIDDGSFLTWGLYNNDRTFIRSWNVEAMEVAREVQMQDRWLWPVVNKKY